MKVPPVILIILDGWALRDEKYGNAVLQAKTPHFDILWSRFPCAKLSASGQDVGLPSGQMGNSEVGHLTLGSGRVIDQDLTRLQTAIADGSFALNEVIQKAINYTISHKKQLHICGLLSDGGIHSHISHMMELIKMASEKGLHQVWVHVFLDGRDVSPKSADKYILLLQQHMAKYKTGNIATMCGRLYAMDRDRRFERTRAAYDALVKGEGKKFSEPLIAFNHSLDEGLTDEFMPPMIMVDKNGINLPRIQKGDTVILSNFRADRMRQLTSCLLASDENNLDLNVITLTPYDDRFSSKVAFPVAKLDQTLGQVISSAGLTQLRIAETEKYPHVTWFFNGKREEPFLGEGRSLIPSPKVTTYDLQPTMSAFSITETFLQTFGKQKINFSLINFANADMVGHSGKMAPTITAVETVDTCLGQICNHPLIKDSIVLITADHGNAEMMIDSTGQPHTAHTTFPVPLIMVNNSKKWLLKQSGSLVDIAPTVLELLNLPIPKLMTGKSLLINS